MIQKYNDSITRVQGYKDTDYLPPAPLPQRKNAVFSQLCCLAGQSVSLHI